MTQEMADAVADYADTVEERLDEYMTRVGLGDTTLETRAYRDMMDTFDELEKVLAEYSKTDETEFELYFGILRMLMRSQAAFLGERQRFDNAGPELLGAARSALAEARQRVEAEVIIHMEVPEELADTSDVWEGAAEIAEDVAADLPKLVRVRGWGGEAAREYRTMADVQCNAAREYVHLPRAMADAYRVLGSLNRAVLIAVDDALTATLLAVRSVAPGTPGRFFHRLEHFIREVEAFNTIGLPAALDIAGEAVEEVSEVVEDTCHAPHVISQRWPSGTAQAGRAAANTLVHRWH